MPLDVQPLSPTRRAIMIVVLLVLFAGSMAIAQLLVSAAGVSPTDALGLTNDRAFMAFGYSVPKGFAPMTARTGLAAKARVALQGQVAGLPRFFFVMAAVPVTPLKTLDDLDDIAEGAYEEYFQTPPQNGAESTLSGTAAVDLSGRLGRARGFARMRTCYVADHVVSLIYTGAFPISDDDERIWDQFAGSSFRVNTGG